MRGIERGERGRKGRNVPAPPRPWEVGWFEELEDGRWVVSVRFGGRAAIFVAWWF